MMKKYKQKILSALLCALLLLNMAGCAKEQSPDEADNTTDIEQAEPDNNTETAENSSEVSSLAQSFADYWQETQANQNSDELYGCGLYLDMDNDGTKELILLCDGFDGYDAHVYHLDSENVEEIGSFTLNRTDPVLLFTTYQTSSGILLKNVAVRTSAAESAGSETEESYITMEGGKILQEILFCTSFDGVDTYYDSVLAGANEISEAEFQAMRDEILAGAKELDKITFEPEDFVDLSDADALTKYLETLVG